MYRYLNGGAACFCLVSYLGQGYTINTDARRKCRQSSTRLYRALFISMIPVQAVLLSVRLFMKRSREGDADTTIWYICAYVWSQVLLFWNTPTNAYLLQRQRDSMRWSALSVLSRPLVIIGILDSVYEYSSTSKCVPKIAPKAYTWYSIQMATEGSFFAKN